MPSGGSVSTAPSARLPARLGDEAMSLIVRGFIEPISRGLPMEYSVELNRLIQLEMDGSVG